MSSAHARIRRVDRAAPASQSQSQSNAMPGGLFCLEDLDSHNGTLVNGKPAVHLALADGDVIEMGHTLLLLREEMHAPPGTPSDVDTQVAAFPGPGLRTLIPGLGEEFDALSRIAGSPVPVLLRGETGTGKELVARAVHSMSRRAGAFVPVNCGAIPQSLVEGQLFGHVKGAFSGAVRDEPGFVRAADRGTLFLDEIGDLPTTSQAALLRVLQEGEVVPVGSARAVRVDIRVVAATNQPLEALVARGGFRADLLARLDGFTCTLPSLRERREDLGLIIADLLHDLSPDDPTGFALTPEVGRALVWHAWPFNVRELRQCLARVSALAQGGRPVGFADLPAAVAAALRRNPASSESPADEEGEEVPLQAQLEALLTEHRGNVAEVARAMGKARMQVHRWMKRLAIDPNRFRG
jgi:transcriptional regulator with PAS, ATPase and Fis domain